MHVVSTGLQILNFSSDTRPLFYTIYTLNLIVQVYMADMMSIELMVVAVHEAELYIV